MGGLGGFWWNLGELARVALEVSRGVLEGSWGILGGSWCILGLSLGDLGAMLGVSWDILEVSWGYLGESQVVDKMVAFLMSPPMLNPIAVNFNRILTTFQSFKQVARKSVC